MVFICFNIVSQHKVMYVNSSESDSYSWCDDFVTWLGIKYQASDNSLMTFSPIIFPSRMVQQNLYHNNTLC